MYVFIYLFRVYEILPFLELGLNCVLYFTSWHCYHLGNNHLEIKRN